MEIGTGSYADMMNGIIPSGTTEVIARRNNLGNITFFAKDIQGNERVLGMVYGGSSSNDDPGAITDALRQFADAHWLSYISAIEKIGSGGYFFSISLAVSRDSDLISWPGDCGRTLIIADPSFDKTCQLARYRFVSASLLKGSDYSPNAILGAVEMPCDEESKDSEIPLRLAQYLAVSGFRINSVAPELRPDHKLPKVYFEVETPGPDIVSHWV